jgi:Arc/MetJ-type ribon-helix-helix transcriptional regulator
MVKTAVYLPEELKARVDWVAEREGRSRADVIRAALDEYTAAWTRPRPTLPLIEGGNSPPDLAERIDEYLSLSGFGED